MHDCNMMYKCITGMGSRDGSMESGTGWDFPSVSFPSHGTVGWDGQ